MAKMHEFQQSGVTIVVVAHNPGLIAKFCDRAIWLEHGRVEAIGPSRDVIDQYSHMLPHMVEVA
jgi:ABC-type polysaccharide/polyol phosphate transport system ATPase subunit